MRLSNKVLGTVAYLGGLPAVLEEFAWAWGQLVQFTTEQCLPGTSVHFDRATLSLHDVARNDLARRMRGDWLLMLDCDHAPEPDLVWRMLDRLDSAKIDVLTGLYPYKRPPHSPVLYVRADDLYAPVGSWRPVDPAQELGLFRVDAAGGGCLLVRRAVFDRVEAELGEGPFDRLRPLGEDMSFFKRLERLGIPAYCDGRVECPHLAVRAVTMADYDRDAVTLGPEEARDGFAFRGEGVKP